MITLKDLSTAITNFWRGLSLEVVDQCIDQLNANVLAIIKALASYQGIKTTLTKVTLMTPPA
jgi:hypothetical protein